MNQDPNEKDMIGDLLDDSFENVTKIKKSFTSNRPTALQINQNHNQSPIYYPKVYSPQVQQKQNSYDLDLRLTKVLVQQSAPNSALIPKSYDYVPQFNLDDDNSLEGDLISKCKDQNGARNIQKAFQEGSQTIKEQIFNKLEKGLLSLSKDVFGNYVIQNLLEYGTSIQQQKILSILQPHSSQLAFHQYGCRVLQKLLQNAYNTTDFPILFDTIKNKVRDLVIDQHGNHVVQKLIQLMESDISLWVLDGIEGQVNKLVINSFGCRIIQKAVSISNNHPDRQMKILIEIVRLAYELIISQYGNYIIQQLLKEGPLIIKNIIQQIIMEKLEEYSLNKFGSNVVDCAIKCSDNQFKLKIMELLLSHNNQQVLFVRLSTNAYGNYVVQNFFKCADIEIQKELYLKITNNQQLLQEIQQYKFGQFVYQMLTQKLELENFNL
ncbi:unnamed protein product [Paramecium pentaurelia]|uniref:PUM-HD domain-containing protein n=1 Tax=Paramecium pentaurelia TaxID=43138 RepID=A0A8S1VKI0_9CILI|nr:unnamed protein product [Paramecium pentaurelia]